MTMTRRTFLASAAAASSLLSARATAANERIGFAVIGCRNRGHQVGNAFLRTGAFELRTVCDCDTAMLDRGLEELPKDTARSAQRETDFRRVLDNPDIDAVIVATPDHWHAAMTIMALEAGKHVYVEKPASYNIGDGRRMVAASAAHPDRVVQVGTQQRSGRHFMEAKQFIEEGGLGRIGFCRTWIAHTRNPIAKIPDSTPPPHLDYEMWVGPAPMHPYNENRTHYNWHWVRDWGTGEMGNWGAHWLDVARWLLGVDLPSAAYAHGGQFLVKDIKEWPDTQTVVYEYPELTLVWEQRLWVDYQIHGMRNGVEIAGDKATLLINRSGWTVHPRGGEPENHRASELERAHAQSFADAIREGAAPSAPIGEGCKSAALCHLGNIAAVTGDRIVFNPATQTITNTTHAAKQPDHPYRKPWTNTQRA